MGLRFAVDWAVIHRSTRALILISTAQLFALGLWFSASAVAPQLVEAWQLSDSAAAGLTMAVQLGFVVGAVVSALLNLADIVPARRLFMLSAAIGGFANLGLLTVGEGETSSALALRFVTGAALAGVYPSGMKVMAGWFAKRRGMALGALVGALTIGSASPHLVRGIGFEWQGVVITASLLAFVSIAMMAGTGDGPHESPPRPFDWKEIGGVVRNRGWRLSTGGYLGHMWELYAMWTWIAAWLVASAAAAPSRYPDASTLTFVIIAAGGPAAWWAGILADRWGRPVVAGGSLAISGSIALLSPLLFGGSPWLVVPILVVWGAAVVADSAQFSALVTETSSPTNLGTALTLQTAIGFLLTLVTIRATPELAARFGWEWAFPFLAAGPIAGIWAMRRLALGERTAASAPV